MTHHPTLNPDATRNLLVGNSVAVPNKPLPTQIDRYVVRALLGEGAFGKVYLADDDMQDCSVAVKVFRRKSPLDQSATDEFLAEASIAIKLQHPNIVPILDVGRTPDGECYIVSEYIDGMDLETLMKTSNGLSPEESARIVSAIASALDCTHRQAVIHRDIKPANILLDREMTPYITDFGVATEARSASHAGRQVAGTPLYMSPEQIECTAYLLDGRSDVFSLGVVLYQMLTGEVPFAAQSLEELKRKIACGAPVNPRELNPGVSARLGNICLRAMAKSPNDRYESAGQFASALDDWIADPGDDLVAGDRYVPGRSTSVSQLMNCPDCGLSVPKADACANCHWSGNAKQTGERSQNTMRAYSARRSAHLRNYTLFMLLELVAGLVGLITAAMWIAVVYCGFAMGVMVIVCMTFATGVLGVLAGLTRRLFPIDLKCPACEFRLDEFGLRGGRCLNCDAQLKP